MVLIHTMRSGSAARMIVPSLKCGIHEYVEELCGAMMSIEAITATHCPTTLAGSAEAHHGSRHPFQLRFGASTSMISFSKRMPFLTISAALACICDWRGRFGRVAGYLCLSGSRSPSTSTARLLASHCVGWHSVLTCDQAAYSAPRSGSRTTVSSLVKLGLNGRKLPGHVPSGKCPEAAMGCKKPAINCIVVNI
jgi:hypothetical protein